MAVKTSDLMNRLTVLAEPMRLEILMMISDKGSCCASDILPHFDITQPTLSHHMNVLAENSIVNVQKQGRFMRYSINKTAVGELKDILDHLCEDHEGSSSPVTAAPVPVKAKAGQQGKTSKKKDKDKDNKKKKDKKKKK